MNAAIPIRRRATIQLRIYRPNSVLNSSRCTVHTSMNSTSISFALNYSVETNWTMKTWQPVVFADCSDYQFPDEWLCFLDPDGTKKDLPNATAMYETRDEKNCSLIPPLWTSPPNDPHTLIGLFLEFGAGLDSSGALSKPFVGLTVCTILSVWRRTETWLTPDQSGILVQVMFPMPFYRSHSTQRRE